MEFRDVTPFTRGGIAAIFGTVLLIYSGHWWGNAMASERAELADYKAQAILQDKENSLYKNGLIH